MGPAASPLGCLTDGDVRPLPQPAARAALRSLAIVWARAIDAASRQATLRHAWLHALFESGVGKPIDEALRLLDPQEAMHNGSLEAHAWIRLEEQPFDFHRRRRTLRLQPPATVMEAVQHGFHRGLRQGPPGPAGR